MQLLLSVQAEKTLLLFFYARCFLLVRLSSLACVVATNRAPAFGRFRSMRLLLLLAYSGRQGDGILVWLVGVKVWCWRGAGQQ